MMTVHYVQQTECAGQKYSHESDEKCMQLQIGCADGILCPMPEIELARLNDRNKLWKSTVQLKPPIQGNRM